VIHLELLLGHLRWLVSGRHSPSPEARVDCRVEGVSVVEVDAYKLPVARLGELEEELLLLDTVGNSV
jgi:hypothetical protein